MLGSGFSKQKLKVNLKLAINRLKLLEKKKSEFESLTFSLTFRKFILSLQLLSFSSVFGDAFIPSQSNLKLLYAMEENLTEQYSRPRTYIHNRTH